MRLNNRFSPSTHQKKDTQDRLSSLPYDKKYKSHIVPEDSDVLPVLALSRYSVLLGYAEHGEFVEWLDKRHVGSVSADPLHPESPIISLILKAVNMYPRPAALLDRIIERLQDIRKTLRS